MMLTGGMTGVIGGSPVSSSEMRGGRVSIYTRSGRLFHTEAILPWRIAFDGSAATSGVCDRVDEGASRHNISDDF